MDKAHINGQTILLIKACGNLTNFMGTENISGVMAENIKVNGKKIWCMVVENYITKTVGFIKDNSKTTLNMDKVLTNGQMERFMKADGLMVSSTEKVDSLTQKELSKLVNGKMDKGLNG